MKTFLSTALNYEILNQKMLILTVKKFRFIKYELFYHIINIFCIKQFCIQINLCGVYKRINNMKCTTEEIHFIQLFQTLTIHTCIAWKCEQWMCILEFFLLETSKCPLIVISFIDEINDNNHITFNLTSSGWSTVAGRWHKEENLLARGKRQLLQISV